MITYSKRENSNFSGMLENINSFYQGLLTRAPDQLTSAPTIPLHRYRQGIEEVTIVAQLSSQKTRPGTDTKCM